MGKAVNPDFQTGLERKRIVHFPEAVKLVKDELAASVQDFDEAVDRFNNKKYKYATITAYYAMFHCARALIYSAGYREKSHYYLLVALRALFVGPKMLDEKLILEFHEAMALREDADYHAEFSKEGAESVIESARKMLQKAKKYYRHKALHKGIISAQGKM